jgi:UDP-glucose 4-epimerase
MSKALTQHKQASIRTDDMTEVLVTGSEGFIGSHLVEKLVNSGYNVLGFDIRKNPLQDVTNVNFTDWHVPKVDVVVHLAANPRIDLSRKYPWWDAHLNIVGTINMLHASLKNNVRLFVYASTCQVYDIHAGIPMSESSPCNPRSPYAISKYTGELYCRYFEQRGLNICILRFFNVYGPRQPEGYSIPDLLKKIFTAHDKRVKVYGSPHDSRDYIYVDDVVKAIERVIENADKVRGEVINIGSGVETTIKRLCEIISHVLNKPVELYFDECPKGSPTIRFQANIEKAKKLLNWKPEINLEEGIRRTALSMGFI